MGRRKRLKLAAIARRVFFFVAGSLLVGLLAIFLNEVLAHYMSRAISAPLAVGVSVAFTFWLLRLAKHPPLMLKNVPPLAAGICAGLGVHIARIWLR
jgi:hypothetical protein